MRKTIMVAALIAALAPAAFLDAQENPRVLIQRGERFLAMGNLDAALATYRRVTQRHPDTAEAAEAHNDMGVAYSRKGQIQDAIREYERSLAINDYPLAKFNLGRMLMKQYRVSGADTDRRRALLLLSDFQSHLHRGAHLPPAVSYQRDEIEHFLAYALAFLEQER